MTALTLVSAAGGSTDVLTLANNPVLWVIALGVFAVIVVQSVLYMRAARAAAAGAGMTQAEVSTAFRAGAVAALGPSLAVVVVAIALLPLFGGPAVLVRIGLIGSAAYETGAAAVAAQTAGAELGGPTYTANVFAIAFFSMALGGSMWMIATLILTPLLTKGEDSLAKVNPAVMAVIPTAALLGAFLALGVAEVPKSGTHIATILASAASMGLFLWLARDERRAWLREWALGFAILIGLVVAYLVAAPA